jgi:hypothetical protein
MQMRGELYAPAALSSAYIAGRVGAWCGHGSKKRNISEPALRFILHRGAPVELAKILHRGAPVELAKIRIHGSE